MSDAHESTIRSLRARITELEAERDEATARSVEWCNKYAEACVERDAAHAKGVEEGIEQVRSIGVGRSEGWADHPVDEVCDLALAAFRKEQTDGA